MCGAGLSRRWAGVMSHVRLEPVAKWGFRLFFVSTTYSTPTCMEFIWGSLLHGRRGMKVSQPQVPGWRTKYLHLRFAGSPDQLSFGVDTQKSPQDLNEESGLLREAAPQVVQGSPG